MLIADVGLAELLWTTLWIFFLFMFIGVFVILISDIFRDHELSGWAKALWVIFVIILPFLGIFVYLIARGGKMHERAAKEAAEADAAMRKYVQEAAGTSASTADELAKLASLRNQGVISDAEFESSKAKLLG